MNSCLSRRDQDFASGGEKLKQKVKMYSFEKCLNWASVEQIVATRVYHIWVYWGKTLGHGGHGVRWQSLQPLANFCELSREKNVILMLFESCFACF